MMSFGQIVLNTQRGARRALVATPGARSTVRLGRDRLNGLRAVMEPSPLDLEIIARAKDAKAQLMIFRGQDDLGNASWGFDDSLDENATMELGRLLVESQLYAYRRLASVGVLCIVHTDLGFREVNALREGTRVLLEEIENAEATDDPTAQALAQLDTWALKNFSYFFSVTMARLVSETLPNLMPMIEQRAPSLSKLLTAAGFAGAKP
jgi:hypothetical protein